jgi:hypothetical protein
MSKQYRALISIHITAEDDSAALGQAERSAGSIRDPQGESNPGHLELLGEVPENGVEIVRVVHEESLLRTQLPPD